MDRESAIEKLYSLQKFGIKLGLNNISSLLESLGNPQDRLKCIHVAGSNGKGSTSSFIASILMESGYKTGLYTSPHFVRFNERVRINGSEIPDDRIISFIRDNAELIERIKPTFFEATTAMALNYFAEEGVDFVVLETGMGGRLDATNAVTPLASVITSISLEHTEYLGETLGEIAAEKAGIIKPGRPVFTGLLPEEAALIIQSTAGEKSSEVFELKDFISDTGSGFRFMDTELQLQHINPGLEGKFQRYNASLAVLCLLKSLGIKDPSVIQRGLENVAGNSGIQGRYEYYHRAPDIVFDSAHNPEGITVFLSSFNANAQRYSHRSVLFGVMKDKAVGEMLSLLKNSFDSFYITTIDYQRAADTEMIKTAADEIGLEVSIVADHAGFIREFTGRRKDECLVVLGSMYVLGKIKEELLGCG